MNNFELKEKIEIKKPRYLATRRDLIDSFAIKGGHQGDFVQFGPFYQIYMYAFVIGYHRGERLPFPTGAEKIDFLEIGKWKPSGLADYILLMILNKSEELNLDWNELEELDEDQIEEKIRIIVTAIEEYANAGFAYLQDKLNNEKHEFYDPFVFVNILNSIVRES